MNKLNNDMMFGTMNIKNQSLEKACSNLLKDTEMLYIMPLSLFSVTEWTIFGVKHQLNFISIEESIKTFLKRHMNTCMNECSIEHKHKHMNIKTYKNMCVSINELLKSFISLIISKLIKSYSNKSF